MFYIKNNRVQNYSYGHAVSTDQICTRKRIFMTIKLLEKTML